MGPRDHVRRPHVRVHVRLITCACMVMSNKCEINKLYITIRAKKNFAFFLDKQSKTGYITNRWRTNLHPNPSTKDMRNGSYNRPNPHTH